MPELNLGKILIVLGVVIALIGVAILAGSRIGLGRLPGDIRYRSDGFTFYFPLATSILLSVVLTLVLWIVSRFWR